MLSRSGYTTHTMHRSGMYYVWVGRQCVGSIYDGTYDGYIIPLQDGVYLQVHTSWWSTAPYCVQHNRYGRAQIVLSREYHVVGGVTRLLAGYTVGCRDA